MAQASHPRVYDSIGGGYRDKRVPDPRIAARIHAALGDARTVCNLGAGPENRDEEPPLPDGPPPGMEDDIGF